MLFYDLTAGINLLCDTLHVTLYLRVQWSLFQ